MKKNSVSLFTFCLALAAGLSVSRSQDMAPPLPDWNESSSTLPLDTVAPPLGLLPDPGPESAPVNLPPADAMPDLPPLQGPTDGEAPPDLPDMPGLVLPKNTTSSGSDTSRPAPVDPILGMQATTTHWFSSPREARAEALKEGKPMMLVIAGFEWSPACQSLNHTLLSHAKFQEFARENLVLSFLNVPTQGKFSSGGDSELEQRKLDAISAYRTFLKVRALPTIIFFDSEGHEIDRMVGYNFNKSLVVQSWKKAAERIQSVVTTFNAQHEAKEKRHKMLSETQKYREWTSRTGSTFFAKSVSAASFPAPTEKQPDATEPAVILMDENGHQRTIPLRLLALSDAEIVRRRHYMTPPPDKDVDFPTRTPYSDDERESTPQTTVSMPAPEEIPNRVLAAPLSARPASE